MLNEGMCQKYTDTVRPANIKQSAMPGSITFRYHETIVDRNYRKECQFFNLLMGLILYL
jgi:hypothetical protein